MNINDFDKIWCLHPVELCDRYLTATHEFTKVNILNLVEFRWTSLQPNLNLIQSIPRLCREGDYHCTREHYTMIKIAYELKYNYILIFEDDIKLINKSYWDIFMNNIPNDFDILRLGGHVNKQFIDGPMLYQQNIYWTKSNIPLWSTNGYALSRNGMKYYLDYIEKSYCVADEPLYNLNQINNFHLNYYVSTIPIAYFYKYQSTIRDNNDDDFKDIYYKNIDLDIYN